MQSKRPNGRQRRRRNVLFLRRPTARRCRQTTPAPVRRELPRNRSVVSRPCCTVTPVLRSTFVLAKPPTQHTYLMLACAAWTAALNFVQLDYFCDHVLFLEEIIIN